MATIFPGIVLAPIVSQQRYQLTAKRHSIRELRLVDELNEALFKENFRLGRSAFEEFYNEMSPHLKQGQTKYAISRETKLLLTLRHLAQGSYQRAVGNDVYVSTSKASVSRILNEVLNAMNRHFCKKYIRFPDRKRMATISRSYLLSNRIPNVIGLIDGTHIPIVALKNDRRFPEFIYVNRKQKHSINTLIICDHEYRITYVNARYPGSAHDSFIWRHSTIREYLLKNYSDKQVWLLGDSGFPLEPILITPFTGTARSTREDLLNTHHKSCRSAVERCIGVWKARWRCLRDERGLHYHPTMAGKIVNACAALHNFCIAFDEDYLNVQEELDEVPVRPAGVFNSNLHRHGEHRRQLI